MEIISVILDHRSKESILEAKKLQNIVVQRKKLLTNILITSKNDSRKIMKSVRITIGSTTRIRKGNQLRWFR